MSNILFIVCITLPILCIGSGCYLLIQEQKKRDLLSIVLISIGLASLLFIHCLMYRMIYRDILMS